MKEYGGYLSLEAKYGTEFYDGENVARFNCARSAIECIIELEGYSKIYLPYYLCESVQMAIRRHLISVEFYHIDTDFCPMIDAVEKNAVVLITNYYGVKKNNKSLVVKYGNVIFDNTQSFYEEPIENAYNVYSCRKFFGVCDGAYLITDRLRIDESKYKRFEPENAAYLIDSITYSTNYAYGRSLDNEKQIENEGIRGMSKLSQYILTGIDYEYVKRKRITNYKLLEEKIGKYNELQIRKDDNVVPMVFPLFIKNDSFRKELVAKKIYIPQWWGYLLSNGAIDGFERNLSKWIFPLPIDQRYGAEDMVAIANAIIQLIEMR